MDLKVLDRSALDGLLDPLDQPRNDKCALRAHVPAELDHLLAQLLARRDDSLYRAEALAQVDESEFRRLYTRVLDPAAERDLLVLILSGGGEVDAPGARGLKGGRADERELAVALFGDIFCVGDLLLLAFSELAGLGCGLFFGLGIELACVSDMTGSFSSRFTFSFSFCAFFKAFLDGGSEPEVAGCSAGCSAMVGAYVYKRRLMVQWERTSSICGVSRSSESILKVWWGSQLITLYPATSPLEPQL